MNLVDIKKLANLSRLNIDEEEMKNLLVDFDAILTYVGQVQEAINLKKKDEVYNSGSNLRLKNVMREDIARDDKEVYADKIIKEMPKTEGRYMKVKQIL